MSVLDGLRAAGARGDIAAQESPLASAAMLEFGIDTQPRAAMFLAQVLHESAGLNYFEEIASGAAYEGRRDLGNTQPGDGRRYKGRGPIQLTGRSNYRWAGGRLGLPLEAHPEMAAQHRIGWRIAGLYWQSHGLNQLADAGDFLGITRRINGGTNGLASRQAYYARLRGVDCRPQPAAPDMAAWLSPTELRWCLEYDKLVRAKKNAPRRRALQDAMRAQRKRIWQAAQYDGWGKHNRAKRWHSLKARTT